METNPLLAHRVIPPRERVEKTVVSVIVYVGVMAGLFWYHGEIPERFSSEFFIAAGVSIFLFTFVILSLFKHERATEKHRARMIRMRIDDDRSGRHWSSRTGLNIKVGLGRLVMLAGIAMILAALAVLGRQVWVWYVTDTWVPVSTLQVVRPWTSWLFTKDIWIAGQRALIGTLEWLHVGVPLALMGAFLGAQGSGVVDRARDKAIADRKADMRPPAAV